jgi:hypothetical protein
MGGQTRLSPQTPLGNFSGLILAIALGATRGEAELEGDRERFGLSMGGTLGFGCIGHLLGGSKCNSTAVPVMMTLNGYLDDGINQCTKLRM